MALKRTKWDIVFSKYYRVRDNWTCQRCSKTLPEGSMGLHCSHFVGRSNYATRFNEDNCEALCFGCHRILGGNPIEHREHKLMILGEERFQELVEESRLLLKKRDICTEEFYQEIKAKLKDLTDSLVYDGDE